MSASACFIVLFIVNSWAVLNSVDTNMLGKEAIYLESWTELASYIGLLYMLSQHFTPIEKAGFTNMAAKCCWLWLKTGTKIALVPMVIFIRVFC